MLFQTHGGVPATQLAWGESEEEIAVYYVANSQIELLLVDVASPVGNDLYTASTEAFSIPRERRGVPRLVIGDTVLVGSLEIPMHLPGMVEEGVNTGGVEWPSIPGLTSVVAHFVVEAQRLAEGAVADSASGPEDPGDVREQDAAGDAVAAPSDEGSTPPQSEAEDLPESEPGPEADHKPEAEPVEPGVRESQPSSETEQPDLVGGEPEPQPAATAPADADTAVASIAPPVGDRSSSEGAAAGTSEPSLFDRLPVERPTPMANFRNDPVGNGMSVVVLIGMLVCVGAVLGFPRLRSGREPLSAWVLVLAVAGMAVAGYLAYIEMTRSLAVCGPVGDCNTVQQSEYARLFGYIPVGVVGLLGYVLILAAWWVSRLGDLQAADLAKAAVFAVSFVGTLFSIYLTFLEPFVIGATCAWCLTSSVVITVLMVLSVSPAVQAWPRLRGSETAH